MAFHFSIRFVVGLCGMWESRSDFQGLWKAGCAFHQSVISTGKVLFRRRLLFGFLRLLDAVTRDIELEDDAMMHESVDRSRRGHRVFEDAFPL